MGIKDTFNNLLNRWKFKGAKLTDKDLVKTEEEVHQITKKNRTGTKKPRGYRAVLQTSCPGTDGKTGKHPDRLHTSFHTPLCRRVHH